MRRQQEKPYKLADGGGLHLLVERRKQTVALPLPFGGKENMISFGTFPEISIADARAKRECARKLLAKGEDPSQQRKLDKIAAATAAKNTFGVIAEEHLDNLKIAGKAYATIIKARWFLQDLSASLTKRPIAEISPAEILIILKRIEASGRRETAKKLRSTIGRVFRLAVATLRAPTDPTYALKDALLPPVVTHRPAITLEAELGAFLLSLDEYQGWATVRASLQFLMLTMTRPGETRLMRRGEIVWQTSTWKIPAERMKMRVAHDVPLSKQALAVLRNIWDASEGNGYVFPSIRSPKKPLSENAMNQPKLRCAHLGIRPLWQSLIALACRCQSAR